MEDKTRLGAAVVGGYILGRTKKGGMALRLATFLSGNQMGPQVMATARKGVTSVAQSEEAKQLVEQVRGPLMEAVRTAALTAATNRVTKMSNGLANRTAALTGDTIESTAEEVTDTTEKVTDGAKGVGHKLSEALKRRRGKDNQPKDEAEGDVSPGKSEGEGEAEGEDQQPEGETQGEDQGENQSEGEDQHKEDSDGGQ
jgi:hypothetical protein